MPALENASSRVYILIHEPSTVRFYMPPFHLKTQSESALLYVSILMNYHLYGYIYIYIYIFTSILS